MTGYTVHVATRNPSGGDPQAELEGLSDFAEVLTPHSGVVAGGQAGYEATVSIDAVDEHDAYQRGNNLIIGAVEKVSLPNWPVVRLEVLTDDEVDRDLARPTLPDMVSGQVAADILGVTRQRLHQLRDNPRFPSPLIDQPGAILWARAAIEAFDQSWTRKPGRPAATSRIEVYQDAATAGWRWRRIGASNDVTAESAEAFVSKAAAIRSAQSDAGGDEPVDLTGVDPAASTTLTGQAASDELKGARKP